MGWVVLKHETSSRDRRSFLTTVSLSALSVRDGRLATSHRTRTATTTITAYLSGSPLSQLKLLNEEVWSFRNWTNASLGRLGFPFSPWNSLFQLKGRFAIKKSTDNLTFTSKDSLNEHPPKATHKPTILENMQYKCVSGLFFGSF